MSHPGWRTLAAGSLLLAVLVGGGHGLVRLAMPAMQSVFESLMAEFRVLRFGLDREGGDAVLRVEVTRSNYVLMGGRAIEPNSQGTANASTLALQTLFGPFLALWVTLAWPLQGPAFGQLLRLASRLAIASVPAAALALLDSPVVLAAQIWTLMLDHFAPGEFSPLVAASRLLQSGGRYALGLLIGAAAVAAADALTSRGGTRVSGQ